MRFGASLLPLFAVNYGSGPLRTAHQLRYLGVAYHINDQGTIATCKHIVAALQPGEELCGIEMHPPHDVLKAIEVRCHPRCDFAIATVSRKSYEPAPIWGGRQVELGTDVMSYGFTSSGIVDGRYATMPRLFKGHIVRVHDTPILSDARSTCELSFPALNGFSGAPLFFNRTGTSVAGMIFSNYQSTITLHSVSEVTDSGKTFSEEIHKVLELGVAHTAFDIRHFLHDLGVTRVCTDTPNPEPLS